MLYGITQNLGSLLLIGRVSCVSCIVFIMETNLTLDTGHYDSAFSKGTDFHFNSNTLKNAETHLRDIHFLDEGGDIWRVCADDLPQASGVVNGVYERVILFCQKEFKNAFLE